MSKIEVPCLNACVLEGAIQRNPQIAGKEFTKELLGGISRKCQEKFNLSEILSKEEKKELLAKWKKFSPEIMEQLRNVNNQFDILYLILEFLNFGKKKEDVFTVQNLFQYMQMQYPLENICTACRKTIIDLLQGKS